MTGFLSALACRFAARPAKAQSTVCRILDLGTPADPVYAVGDVHGSRDLLTTLIDRIRADAAPLGGSPLVILLGDMVDRGTDSAGVLDLATHAKNRTMLGAILGNHERLMLDFLADPHGNADWLDLGGFETLRSYGLTLPRGDLGTLSARRLRQMLDAHLPDPHLDWLRALPHGIALTLNGQRHLLTHAGYDPARPQDAQTEATLLWGRNAATDPGLRLVQGHIIVNRPDPDADLVRVDTGAWKTGTLTCLRLAQGKAPALLSVTREAAPQDSPDADKG